MPVAQLSALSRELTMLLRESVAISRELSAHIKKTDPSKRACIDQTFGQLILPSYVHVRCRHLESFNTSSAAYFTRSGVLRVNLLQYFLQQILFLITHN
ncbi:hypothetical protein [Virgibacillus sp. L01]|uniref:hypothetical protein n=1 Tax=Virgibacillus sp. L01 TaxID=3457429 RepID=UPI003FD536E1